jgi:ribosome maturation factor RimP
MLQQNQNTAQREKTEKTGSLAGDSGKAPHDRLISFLEESLEKIGYDLVAIEITNHRERLLRIFVDFPEGSPQAEESIGIEDCVKVTHELDQPLEANVDMLEIFNGAYELEISSPGVDRPLRRPRDYDRYHGEIGRVHTFRAITAEESNAPEYITKNPKQKNFYGIVRGYEAETSSILFGIIPEDGTRETVIKGEKKGQKKSAKKAEAPKKETLVRIPLELISKANLEPAIELPDDSEDE